MERILRPEKHWKFSSSDVNERAYWDDYQKAYEDLIAHTSTEKSPWYIIPADRKWYARYAVSEIMLHLMIEMNPTYPELAEKEKENLAKWKKILEED